jgi:DNA-binding transcriptional LysR family regulator
VEIAFGARERVAMLRDGRAQVGLMHSPQDDITGLDAEELLAQHQVVVLSERHPLAQRAAIHLADLHGQTMPRWPGMPDGNGTGPLVGDISQLIQLITLGRMVAVVPESVRAHLRSGLVCRLVPDAPAATIVLVWPRHRRSPHVAEFVRAASAKAHRRIP